MQTTSVHPDKKQLYTGFWMGKNSSRQLFVPIGAYRVVEKSSEDRALAYATINRKELEAGLKGPNVPTKVW